jgi:hypothetical protein
VAELGERLSVELAASAIARPIWLRLARRPGIAAFAGAFLVMAVVVILMTALGLLLPGPGGR